MASIRTGHPTSDGQVPWTSVLPVIIAETGDLRAALHRSSVASRCDLQVRAPARDGDLILIDGDCLCRNLLVDMLVEAHQHLTAHPGIHNPAGAIRVHLRTRATKDWIRSRRLAMGAQARCDRIRYGARARGLPDEFHRALLEYLVDEAGSPAPLDDDECLLRRLAVRCAGEFGGEPADHLGRVRTGIRLVEQHCRSGPRVNAGTTEHQEVVTWWERYIEHPLGRRPRRAVGALPEDACTVPGPDTGHRSEDAADDHGHLVDQLVIDQLVGAFRRQPGSPTSALRAGLVDLQSAGLVSAPTVHSLLHDERRMEIAVRELSALA